MILANDILQRRDEIKQHVATANFDSAVKRLIDFTRDFCQDHETTALLISNSYHMIYQSELQGGLEFKEILKEKNSIALRILNTLSLAAQTLVTDDGTPS